MGKETQLEFPFVKEDNKLQGKTCENCFWYDEPICRRFGKEMGEGDSCGEWKMDTDKAQKKDSIEFKFKFDDLCDMYGITDADRETIRNLCKLF